MIKLNCGISCDLLQSSLFDTPVKESRKKRMAATINTPRKAPKQTPNTRSVPDNPVFSTNWPITKFTIAPTIRVAINSTAMAIPFRTSSSSKPVNQTDR